MSPSRSLTRLPRSRPATPSPRRTATPTAPPPNHLTRAYSSTPPPPAPKPNFHTLLATPTWSVRSLLPSPASTTPSAPPPTPPGADNADRITPQTLHHLLRLSALPPPASPAAEAALLATLHAQLHFVRAIQAVDTAAVRPLAALRDDDDDESPSAAAATTTTTITLDALLQGPLAGEHTVGFRRRPRRRRAREEGPRSALEADVAEKTRARRGGPYYVVEGWAAKGRGG